VDEERDSRAHKCYQPDEHERVLRNDAAIATPRLDPTWLVAL
jgi:hypothetical protein